MRLRTAALICIFTRSLTCFGYGRCRNGRCSRSRLARSSRWSSCKPVPLRSLQTFHQISKELVSLSSWRTLLYPSRSIGFRGLAKPYATEKSCACSSLPDFASNPSTGRHGRPEQSCLRELHHLSLVRFPETIFERFFLVAFHVIPFKQPSCVSHQPRPHVRGGCHFH